MTTTMYNTWACDVHQVTEIEQSGVVQVMALIGLDGDHPDDPPFYVPADQVTGLDLVTRCPIADTCTVEKCVNENDPAAQAACKLC